MKQTKQPNQGEHHSSCSPSQLSRIFACPGSVKLIKNGQLPSTTNAAAEEGTALHSVVAAGIQIAQENSMPSLSDTEIAEQCDIYEAPHEISAISTCIEAARAMDMFCNQPGLIEHPVCISSTDVYGTADYINFTDDELFIYDWKFGKGVYVDEDSDQTRAYAAGAMDTLQLRTLANIESVSMGICQPRFYGTEPLRIKFLPVNELKNWVENKLKPALKRVEDGRPFKAGSHCRWCLAKHVCRTYINAKKADARVLWRAYVSDEEIQTVPLDELVHLHTLGQEFQKFTKSLGAYLMAQLTSGKDVPGYKLVHGRSLRRWTNTSALLKFLKTEFSFSLEDVSEAKLLSPAKLEKMLPKGAKKKIQKFIEKPEGKLTMAPSDDLRPAVEAAEELFKDFVKEDK